MSAARNARKKGVSKPVRSPIRERGQVKHGEKPAMTFSSITQNVAHAVLKAKFHITRTEMSTEYLNTSIYPVLMPIADPVISVFITVDSNARDAVRLERNKKVDSAIHALAQTIRNELYLLESTGRESGTKSNLIKEKVPMRGKKNGG